MHILFFTHYFPPEVNAPASRTYEMCKRWVAAGHQVTVVTGAPNAPDGVLYPGFQNKLRQTDEMDGIKVVRVWTFLAANKGTVKRMLNYISFMVTGFFGGLFVRKPDIVIATSPQMFCGWAGALCSIVKRRPFIIEVRDMFAESITTLTSRTSDSLMVRTIRWLEFVLYRLGVKTVTVGPGYVGKLIKGGVPENRIEVITNGVDRDFFDPETSADLREEWGLDGKFVVTYAGTIGMAHALHVCLEAANLLKQRGIDDVLFLLVGEGAERAELEVQANALGLENVRFAGKHPKSMMPRIIAASDTCLVHLRKAPLYLSVFPSKIFEIFQMKRSIILGVEGEAAKLVESAGGGLCIEPENVEQLIEAILKLKSDPELAASMGQRGHDYVGNHFDRDKLAKDYLALIEDCRG